MDPVTLLISFLGGGITSAIIVQLFARNNAKHQRKIALLEEQIRELYGPLFYLVARNDLLLGLSKRFLAANQSVFLDVEYSREPLTRERVSSQSKDTVELSNQSVQRVREQNDQIIDLLNAKFSYIDPGDIEIFLQFFEDHYRLSTEFEEGKGLKTPLQIYEQIGEISFLRPEFIERVKSQFQDKKSELEQLVSDQEWSFPD